MSEENEDAPSVPPALDPRRIAYALVADFITYASWAERVVPELRGPVGLQLDRIAQAMRAAAEGGT